jgi:DHA1 family multidrug resistance protein-like MFS transporter
MRAVAAPDPPQRWRRTFWSVWAANLVTTMGLQSFLPFFPSHLEELGVVGRPLVAVWTGAVFGAAPLAAALTGPVWGWLGDRIGRRAMVLRSLVATSLFVGLMALARSPLELLLLRLLQGAFSGVIAPSITLVSVGAPRERQGEVAGRLQSALALGAVAGPMLGAVVSTWASARSVFCVVASLAAAGALGVACFAHEQGELRREQATLRWPGVFAQAKREAEELWKNPRVRAAVVLAFWIQFAVSATAPLIELHVRDVWRGDESMRHYITGALFTGMALASLVATQAWGRLGDRIGAQRALWISGCATAALLLSHAFVPGLLLLAFSRPLLGAAMAGNAPCAFAVAAAETDVAHRGGGLGIVFSGRSLAIAFAALCGGCLSTLLGIRGLFAASALALGVVMLLHLPRRGDKDVRLRTLGPVPRSGRGPGAGRERAA